MQEHDVEQQAQGIDEPVEGTEGAAADSDVAAAVDAQAAQSSGAAAEAAPEVPDDAGQTIQRAQEHIDKLNMDAERAAAKKAM